MRGPGFRRAVVSAAVLALACSDRSSDMPGGASSDDAARYASEPDARVDSPEGERDGGSAGDATADIDAGATDTGPDVADASDASDGDAAVLDAGSDAGDARTALPPITPVYRIELRIHTGQSGLPRDELAAVLDEINFVWWSQAGVCFEIHSSKDDVPLASGFDLWFVPELGEFPDSNGIIYGDHEIYSRDYPILEPAENPIHHPAARTASHELGHGLGLAHHNDQPDSPESLMASRQAGYMLHDFEIAAAREQAALKALPDTARPTCAPPKLE